ncbi:glucose-6-phosphate isomerase [Paracoccus sp. S-4012]|uniref:glucose-6-phosphate isomerase n=1 Tax=Paracoccus sp. S-4012 TaxID=2665648 RepID=UPI0012AFC122|nr:glucose-6-phosphate isomerase [Paracoccus sp. S-4012]MRX51401.1 glucose-6-phosphate isomerase [Paracoccus sp. S-4012]
MLETEWQALTDHRRATEDTRIDALFAADRDRAARFSTEADGLLLDWSKTAIDDRARDLLLALARAAGVEARREAMFSGETINETEGRAVLHTALRAGPEERIEVDGTDVVPGVHATLARMRAFAEAVRGGGFTVSGGRVTDVVNIGIGGSDLGPAMAARALSPWLDGPRLHFVSNVDSADFADTVRGLHPATTLVVIASKTFTTLETMTNAASARAWLAAAVPDPAAHFAAVSSALDRTAAFGIPEARVFGFEDWVGGRYSMWGPIGLSLMLGVGPDPFDRLLDGARAMDRHFREAPLDANLPVILGLTGIWHRQLCGYPTRAVIPYDQRLARLPAYLQQLEMESNGKRVAMDGGDLTRPSGPVVWGEPGTNGQHAFFQLIHQGTQVVPCEFILTARGHEPQLARHHLLLAANCLAQAEALMRGRPLDAARALLAGKGLPAAEAERQARHRVFPGNRPSVLLLMDELNPFTLGQLVALYEHRVFVEGVVLGINSFDQWGVELGKELAASLVALLEGEDVPGHDPSTERLAARVRDMAG